MQISYKHHAVKADFIADDSLIAFFIWLTVRYNDERCKAMLDLIARHDVEPDKDEQANIRRTIVELLENEL